MKFARMFLKVLTKIVWSTKGDQNGIKQIEVKESTCGSDFW